MIGGTRASDGSVAIGGDNSGPVVNVKAGAGSNVSVQINPRAPRQLPSFLGRLVSVIASEQAVLIDDPSPKELPPSVLLKFSHNNVRESDLFVDDY